MAHPGVLTGWSRLAKLARSMPPRPDSLRVALLVYRGNPHSGGQGVYTRELARELVALGHQVTVLSGQPYPDLADGTGFVAVPSLDLYRQPDPFRFPRLREFQSGLDVLEFAMMCTAAFPEPLTFSLRARRLLQARVGQFDVVHDNQCLGTGIARMVHDGWPVMATLHHPITVDRRFDLAHATTLRRRVPLRRWYGFLGMQMRVIPQIPRIVTVSESSKRDICEEMGARPGQLRVVPVGVDVDVFRPRPDVTRVPGRIMATSSSDVPMKGVVPLLEAVAKLRTERHIELVVIGKPRRESNVQATIDRLGLGDAVSFHGGVTTDRIVELYASSQVAVVPSLYEGFSLPAIEAMACGVPLVATPGGARPEVVATDGRTGLLVPPDDPSALALALGRVLDDRELAGRLSEQGRRRVLERFTWRACAVSTLEHYRWTIEDTARRRGLTQAGA